MNRGRDIKAHVFTCYLREKKNYKSKLILFCINTNQSDFEQQAFLSYIVSTVLFICYSYQEIQIADFLFLSIHCAFCYKWEKILVEVFKDILTKIRKKDKWCLKGCFKATPGVICRGYITIRKLYFKSTHMKEDVLNYQKSKRHN